MVNIEYDITSYPSDYTLKGLYEMFCDGDIAIPDYQRGYSWELSQLKDFWYDVLNVMESGNMYYTGMISFKRITKKEINIYENFISFLSK